MGQNGYDHPPDPSPSLAGSNGSGGGVRRGSMTDIEKSIQLSEQKRMLRQRLKKQSSSRERSLKKTSSSRNSFNVSSGGGHNSHNNSSNSVIGGGGGRGSSSVGNRGSSGSSSNRGNMKRQPSTKMRSHPSSRGRGLMKQSSSLTLGVVNSLSGGVIGAGGEGGVVHKQLSKFGQFFQQNSGEDNMIARKSQNHNFKGHIIAEVREPEHAQERDRERVSII